MKYALALIALSSLLLFAISFFDQDIKPKEVFLVTFGMLLGVAAFSITNRIDHEKKTPN